MPSQPHGGKLIPLEIPSKEAEEIQTQNPQSPRVPVMGTVLEDLELFAVGGYSPLTGFLTKKEYESVVETMRLPNGLPLGIPVTAPVPEEKVKEVEKWGSLFFVHNEKPVAFMEVTDIYTIDPELEARKVFRTTDPQHPGVNLLFSLPKYRVGGKLKVFPLGERPFLSYRKTPQELRNLFAKKGFQTIAAFQTRNPIHRAHEYLTKVALEITDALLLHPLVGTTKSDDIPAEVRMRCYEIMMEKYYNPERVILSVYPGAMRYAGPREAIFHAIIRKNYGCTHFIVGRDHAGVGNYYGTYDAQKIFDEFREEELGIIPLKFENAFYCLRTKQMATSKTSPSLPHERIALSGTQVREMLKRGEKPPEEFTRPEVAEILIASFREKSLP
jgi:sulfate adenylyltransferase